MNNSNAHTKLNHLYGLLMEINFHRPEEDILTDQERVEDPFIRRHLLLIKKQRAKMKALANKNAYLSILNEIKRLKENGLDEIKGMLSPNARLELVPLFNKFEELTKKDEADIADDQELLQIISILKDKLENGDNQ
jgi:hypothetical protein